MQHEADLDLIREAQAGSQQAFRLLVERHQAFAFRLAFRFLDHRAESEDMVQESFIRVWKNLGRYNPEFRFTTWLGRMVTNLCLDRLRERKRRNTARTMNTDELTHLADSRQTESALEMAELNGIVKQLAEQLSEQQRAVFVLRDLESLSVEETGEILGLSAGNIKSNLYYARLKMKEGITRYYQQRIPNSTR